MLLLRMVVGLYVLNLGYLGEGSFTQLKECQFVSKTFSNDVDITSRGGNRFRDSWLGELPMPFPANYIIDIDLQQRDFEDFSRPSYMNGHYEAKGWWYCYAYAILLKAPLGTLGLLGLAMATSLIGFGPKLNWRDAMILLAPAGVIFAVASSKSGFSHHSRYVLPCIPCIPCIPFVLIWISGLAVHVQTFWTTSLAIWNRPRLRSGLNGKRMQSCTIGLLASLLLLTSIGGSLSVHPHSMSYFNLLTGGPKNGPEYLLNSNIDWAQDLLFLKRWIKNQPQDDNPVYLAFDNYYNPFDLEIPRIEPWPFAKNRDEDSNDSDSSIVPNGDYAISVNQLYEFPWPLRRRDDGRCFIDHRPIAYLCKIEPIGRAGYSIRIYSADQLRAAFSAPVSPRLWSGFPN